MFVRIKVLNNNLMSKNLIQFGIQSKQTRTMQN